MDRRGRVRLNVRGSLDDLARQPVRPGVRIVVYCEEFEAEAVVEWSDDEAIWVARLDSQLRALGPH